MIFHCCNHRSWIINMLKLPELVSIIPVAYYDFYEITVEYNGGTYELENAHNTYQYPQGATVKAYLANNGRLFANVEGVSSSTPLATVYFVCLFGSFGLLFAAATYSGKAKQEKMR